MKTILIKIAALAVLSLLVPGTGLATNNQIGFYTDLDLRSSHLEGYNVVAPFPIYVVIHNPYNPNSEADVANLGGFEFMIDLPPGAFVLDSSYPVQALNVGLAANEYIVGFGEPLPVVSGTPTLVLTLNVLAQTDCCQFFYLVTTTEPSIPDEIALLDFDTNDIIPMYIDVGGEISYPIFVINLFLAVEDMSLDGVKALFR